MRAFINRLNHPRVALAILSILIAGCSTHSGKSRTGNRDSGTSAALAEWHARYPRTHRDKAQMAEMPSVRKIGLLVVWTYDAEVNIVQGTPPNPPFRIASEWLDSPLQTTIRHYQPHIPNKATLDKRAMDATEESVAGAIRGRGFSCSTLNAGTAGKPRAVFASAGSYDALILLRMSTSAATGYDHGYDSEPDLLVMMSGHAALYRPGTLAAVMIADWESYSDAVHSQSNRGGMSFRPIDYANAVAKVGASEIDKNLLQPFLTSVAEIRPNQTKQNYPHAPQPAESKY